MITTSILFQIFAAFAIALAGGALSAWLARTHEQLCAFISLGAGTLLGVAVCALGILLAGAAGISKEKELSAEQKKASVREFNLKLGLAVGIFAGVMSACFAFGLDAGNPIKAFAVAGGSFQ